MFRLIFLFIILNGFVFAQQNLETYFEIDQEAVNRILLESYESSAVHFSGSAQGYNYDLQLQVPEVRFTSGYMHLNATLTAVTDVGNFEWSLTPAIAVDYDVSLDDLHAVITAFDTWVQANLAGAPFWLKNVVIQHYEDLELTIYPSKILDYATSFVPSYIDLEVTNIDDLSIESQDRKLIIGIQITIDSHPITIGVQRSGDSWIITSNVEITIDQIEWADYSNGVIERQGTDHLIQKDGNYTYNNINESEDVWIVKLHLKNPYNQIIRTFWKNGGVFILASSIN